MIALFEVKLNGKIIGSIHSSDGESAIAFFRGQVSENALGLWKASRI